MANSMASISEGMRNLIMTNLIIDKLIVNIINFQRQMLQIYSECVMATNVVLVMLLFLIKNPS